MSKLYGWLEGDKGTVTKASQRVIDSLVQTKEGGIAVMLQANGDYEIWLTAEDPGSQRTRARTKIAEGNINACPR